MQILGISGSLRKDAYNTALLEAAATMLPPECRLSLAPIDQIPLYNQDLDGPDKPAPVKRFIDSIASSDGLLFATPEYNHSIPGVLKNAIDWASRPAYKSAMAGKPSGILSASISMVGGARVQAHMKQVLASTLCPVYPAPDFLLPAAREKCSRDGRLTDSDLRSLLERYVLGFTAWIQNLRRL